MQGLTLTLDKLTRKMSEGMSAAKCKPFSIKNKTLKITHLRFTKMPINANKVTSKNIIAGGCY